MLPVQAVLFRHDSVGAEILSKERGEFFLDYLFDDSTNTFYWDSVIFYPDEDAFRQEMERLETIDCMTLRDEQLSYYIYIPSHDEFIRRYYDEYLTEVMYWIEAAIVDESQRTVEYFCTEEFDEEGPFPALDRILEIVTPMK